MTILLILLAVVFILGPLYIAVLIAVKDPSEMANVLSFPKKLRLQNFADAWVMTDYPRKFMNTLFITVINLVFTILTNSMVAYAITRNKDKSKLFNLAYYVYSFQCYYAAIGKTGFCFPHGQYFRNYFPVYYFWPSDEYFPVYGICKVHTSGVGRSSVH